MLHTVMTAAFQDIERADYVAVDVAVRIFQRMTHPCLRAKVHHPLELSGSKQVHHRCLVGKVRSHKLESRLSLQAFEARGLERDIVIIVEIVEPDHVVAPLQKAQCGKRSDEAGCARNKDFHE